MMRKIHAKEMVAFKLHGKAPREKGLSHEPWDWEVSELILSPTFCWKKEDLHKGRRERPWNRTWASDMNHFWQIEILDIRTFSSQLALLLQVAKQVSCLWSVSFLFKTGFIRHVFGTRKKKRWIKWAVSGARVKAFEEGQDSKEVSDIFREALQLTQSGILKKD